MAFLKEEEPVIADNFEEVSWAMPRERNDSLPIYVSSPMR
jgi:hypothetical protein